MNGAVLGRWRSIFAESAANWSRHKISQLGAALAYYSIFSIGPLLVIGIAIAGTVFGADAARGEIAAQVKALLGSAGGEALNAMLAGASHPYQGVLATLFGIATLLFAALGVVVQLKQALNAVWDVEAPRDAGWWSLAREYLISVAGVLALGFLLLVSLLFTAGLAALAKFAAPYVPEFALQLGGSALSVVSAAVLFAMMFKWLPDAELGWRDVWFGALFTAALFEIGKFLLGFYIGTQGPQSAYGAATSLVMLLIWVYYSSQIVLFGAEFTRVHAQDCARRRGESGARAMSRGGPAPTTPRAPGNLSAG